jgi:hypothetical protein
MNNVVYLHRRKDNGEIFYVGIGKKNRPYSKSKRNKFWNAVAEKCGWSVEIICEGLSWDDACKKEIELIKQYGRRDLGEGILTNMTDGGEGNQNIIYTPEWIEKQRIASTGRIQSEETKKKRALKQTGVNFSQERKNNISESKKGLNVGSKNPAAVLNETQVKKIKKLIKEKKSLLSISKEFNCGWNTIKRIKEGTHWKHVLI